MTMGLLLIVIHCILLMISPRFAYGELPVLERPTWRLVALLMLAGGVYLLAIRTLRLHGATGRGWWTWMIVVGLVMRALMFPSTPMLETDYFRYLWDGGVTAHGFNPFAHTPEAILAGEGPDGLVALAEDADPVAERVNQPGLTTIYPPVAQIGFALAHQVSPWHISGLRVVWLVCDLITLGLLIGLLRRLGLPASAVLIYWWNPLLIKEGYNTAHMEMVALPLVAAALWLAVRQRLFASAVALALAVGSKLWPLLLLPALLRQRGLDGWRIGATIGGFVLLSTLIVAPLVLTHFGETAGLRAYAGTWRMNETLYQGVHLAGRWLTPDHASWAARVMVGVILAGWIVWLCRRPAEGGREVCERALWIVAALFLLSPTQYPWYWLWLLPMLVVRPSPGLLVLTATLPMYYLRFPLRELGYETWFHQGIVWLQFGPAFALLALEAWQRLGSLHRPRPEPETETGWPSMSVRTHASAPTNNHNASDRCGPGGDDERR